MLANNHGSLESNQNAFFSPKLKKEIVKKISSQLCLLTIITSLILLNNKAEKKTITIPILVDTAKSILIFETIDIITSATIHKFFSYAEEKLSIDKNLLTSLIFPMILIGRCNDFLPYYIPPSLINKTLLPSISNLNLLFSVINYFYGEKTSIEKDNNAPAHEFNNKYQRENYNPDNYLMSKEEVEKLQGVYGLKPPKIQLFKEKFSVIGKKTTSVIKFFFESALSSFD